MAMNRIQFQPGLSLAGFLEQYGTQAACARALRRARWPNGFVCPRCAGRRSSRCANRHGERLWQCSSCRHQTSLISDTLFASTKLPLTRWFLALYLLTQSKTNMAALELMRHLGVCYHTAWRLKHKVMQAMTQREQRFSTAKPFNRAVRETRSASSDQRRASWPHKFSRCRRVARRAGR